jgi:hypothetical protein
MKTRSDGPAVRQSRRELELRAEVASSEAEFMAARARECDRWGLFVEARELRHAARTKRVASLMLVGRAAAAAG